MNAKRPSATERNAAAVAARAERLMADTRFAFLRTRGARLTNVISLCAVLIAQPVVWLYSGVLAGLAITALAFVLWIGLRLSVRLIADLPDEYLDERQLATRNSAYLDSYRWLAGLVAVAAIIAVLIAAGSAGSTEQVTFEVTVNGMIGAFWLIEGVALALPSMVFAVRDRELAE